MIVIKAEKDIRDWYIHFPRTTGKKSEKKIIVVEPNCYFRGEKLIAFDNGNGYATRVGAVFVGERLQHPDNDENVLTATFDRTAVGNGMKWDASLPSETISITIDFLEDGWWEGTVFGKRAPTAIAEQSSSELS